MRVLIVCGTRPELIKLNPVRQALVSAGDECHFLCTGQHTDLVHSPLRRFWAFEFIDRRYFKPEMSLAEGFAECVRGVSTDIATLRPDWVVTQGDTTSATAGSVAAFYAGVKCAHVEAGLRSRDLAHPFPEEGHRQVIARLATLHCAPTEAARSNLVNEGVDERRIRLTGNTVVDSLLEIADRVDRGRLVLEDAAIQELVRLKAASGIVLVTAHRRESFGEGIASIADAVTRLAQEYPLVTFVVVTHPNPRAREAFLKLTSVHHNVLVTKALDYAEFVHILSHSRLAISDSGGVQEEAPTFGVPVLVTRRVTERTEGIDAGVARLVGLDSDVIVREARPLLRTAPVRGLKPSPYGDGRSGTRIRDELAAFTT